jgi:ubiquinone/menaquinone biosynthesis C-methylase UbiE
MKAWYEESFGNDYLIVYKHRDMAGAYQEVHRMIAWLQLPPGASVLDLCCGMGRHSLALADAGYRVTGVDLSPVLLAEARKRDTDNRVAWLQGDMRKVPAEGPFDAVVNLFTSFGYFEDDAENAKVIKEIKRVLRPGGRFLIDFLNPEYVAAHLVPYSERREDGMTIEERRSIEDGFVRKRITIREEGRQERRYMEQVKLYRLEQFESMFREAGLALEAVHGSYDEGRYDPVQSPRLIMIGRKEEEA